MHITSSPFHSIAILVLLMILAGCGNRTHIVDSWHSPDMEITPGHYQKLLSVAMLDNERNRRAAEDQLTGLMPAHAVPSYKHFEHLPEKLDEQQMMAMMESDGYDGILIMRLISIEDDTTYIPGTYYGPYHLQSGRVVASPTYVAGTYPSHYAGVWSYYSHAYPSYAQYGTTGYFDVERYYYYEVNLYDIHQNALVWSSVTSTYEQNDIDRTTEEVAEAVYKEMKDLGFVSDEDHTANDPTH